MTGRRPAAELASSTGPVTFRRIDLWRVAVPMLEPFRISSGEVSRKDAVIIRVSDGEHFGWGESSAMAGAFYSADTPDTCEAELMRLLPSLIGRTFSDVATLEAELASAVSSRFVRVAVETAAWELAARRAGLSVRALFGIPHRAVPSGLAVGLYDADDDLRAAIERYHAPDYRRLKIKIKPGHDVRLVRKVREWFGDIPLFVDANASYSLANLAVFQELDQYGLMMIEQPFAAGDFEGSAQLARAIRTPICLDESVENAGDARRAAETGAARIVNIKLQRVGGYLEALRIMEVCESRGLEMWVGTMPELGIGSAQALMLAADPAFAYPTDVEPSARWYTDDLLAPEPRLDAGHLHTPGGPGIGFTVDEAKLARYAERCRTFGA